MKFEQAISTLLVASALAVGVSVVHREFSTSPAAANPIARPDYVPSWNAGASMGTAVGRVNAKLTVLEIADLECPYCRAFHRDLQTFVKEHEGDVRVVFLHYPLPNHRFAMPAARAADCALEQGRFDEFVAEIFRQQDSLGLRPMTSFAAIAGVPDTVAFRKCTASLSEHPRIASGQRYGNSIGVRGTPTVILNGWRIPGTPSKAVLTTAFDALGKGKKHFDETMADLGR
jgi:protein-disulfide isomerase